MAIEGIASLVPTNVRTFVKNLMADNNSDESLLTADDFTAEEINEIYRQIDAQNAINSVDEQDFITRRDYRREIVERNSTPEAQAKRLTRYATLPQEEPAFWSNHAITTDGIIKEDTKFFDSPEAELAEYNATIQRHLDDAEELVDSYSKNRNRTSITYPGELVPEGESNPYTDTDSGFITTVMQSFNSPAYNISTTLGRYTAHKNEDDTVTIKDTYNWGRQGEYELSLDMFSFMLRNITDPVAFGDIFMRSILGKGKQSTIEFDLPPRQTITTAMPEGYSVGGRVRLI